MLYGGLSQHSAVARNYDRIAKESSRQNQTSSAIDALISLAKPHGK